MKHYALETIEPKRKAAQEIVCQCAFYTCCVLGAVMLITAFVLPTVTNVTKATCYACMFMELLSAVFGYIAYWIKRYTL